MRVEATNTSLHEVLNRPWKATPPPVCRSNIELRGLSSVVVFVDRACGDGAVNVDTHRALAPDDCFRREEPCDMEGLAVDGRRSVAHQNDWNGIHYSSLLN